MAAAGRSVEVTSPVEGTVVSVEHQLGWHVQPGDVVATVVAGDTTVAMRAGVAGIVRQIRTEAGAPTVPGAVLLVVEAYPDTPPPPQRPQPLGPADRPVVRPPGGPGIPPPRCTYCGSHDLEPGFLQDGEFSNGYGRWVQGRLEMGPLGGARLMGKPSLAIGANRCVRCSHLELFAIGPDEIRPH
jgi:hypothetical protein